MGRIRQIGICGGQNRRGFNVSTHAADEDTYPRCVCGVLCSDRDALSVHQFFCPAYKSNSVRVILGAPQLAESTPHEKGGMSFT